MRRELLKNLVIENSDFLTRYEEALERLSAFGLKSKNGRLAIYRKVLSTIGPIDADLLADFDRRKLLNALCEGSLIIEIACLDDAQLTSATQQLGFLGSGVEVENIGLNDKARDYANELFTAALYTGNGLTVSLPEGIGDLVVEDCGNKRTIECKRISSRKKVRHRVKEAVSQLVEGASLYPGLILVDASSAIRAEFGLIHAQSVEESLDQAENQLKSFLSHNFFGKIQLSEVAKKEVLGIIVRFVGYGTVNGPGYVRRSIITQLLCVHPDDSSETTEFVNLSNRLHPGETVDGDLGELTSATQAFPMSL